MILAVIQHLFGAVSLTKHVDNDQYKYFGFDSFHLVMDLVKM